MEVSKGGICIKLKKQHLGTIFAIAVFAVIGFLTGYIVTDFMADSPEDITLLNGLLKIVFIFLSFYLTMILHIIVHESGHLFFGIMTGYSFVSFRVRSFIVTKQDGKFKLDRFKVPGTEGQCLMMPPEMKDGNFPFIMYNLGGSIMNIIISALALAVMLFIKDIASVIYVILGFTGIIGIGLALINAIPMKVGGIPNDGHNMLSMTKRYEDRKNFHIQLTTHGLMSQGMRIKDIPLETFALNRYADLSNPLTTYIKLIEYDWYLDNMEFEKAKSNLISFYPYMNKLIPIYRNEINCERIFLELIGDVDKEFIDRLYSKGLKKYIKATKFMINKKRFLMAYELFYNEDIDKGLKYYEEIKDMAKNHPIKGEAQMELMLAKEIKRKISDLS